MEYEEDRGGGCEEEAKDQRSSDSCPERWASPIYHPLLEETKLRRIYLPDLTELDLPSTMQTHFPDPADLLNFTLTITPDEGMTGYPSLHFQIFGSG